MKRKIFFIVCCGFAPIQLLFGQQKSETKPAEKSYKNVIRYNLSSALLFGFDKCVVIGYERVINPRQSFSINVGKASLPKLVSISTDSFSLEEDRKNTGYNISADYRFYLSKENKYEAPRGVYVGPYYSYNNFKRTNDWSFNRTGGSGEVATTVTNFSIHSIGAELGYQFVFWNRLTLDLVLIGPGLASYHLKSRLEGNLSESNKEQLREAVKEMLTQKFPGMNFVFADNELDADGVMKTWSLGFRYLIHIGFRF